MERLEYYLAGGYDEDKVIIGDVAVLEMYRGALDLSVSKIGSAWVLVPEDTRYRVNNLFLEEGATKPCKLEVSSKFGKSRFRADGGYLGGNTNLTIKYKDKEFTRKMESESNEQAEVGSEELANQAEYYYSTSSIKKAFVERFPGLDSYMKKFDAHPDQHGVCKLLSVSKGTLLWDAASSSKPRPFVHKVSMVPLKNKCNYVLVLDTVLAKFLQKGITEEPIPLNSLFIESAENPLDLLVERKSTLFYTHGYEVIEDLLKEMAERATTLRLVNPAWIASGKVLSPLKEPPANSKFIRKVYSAVPNPEYTELSSTKQTYELEIWQIYNQYFVTEPQKSKEHPILELLRAADTNQEIYRMFCPPPLINKSYVGGDKKYVKEDEIGLYVTKFKSHTKDKTFPIKAIPRHREWEPKAPRDIQEQRLIEQKVAKLRALYKGDPIQAVIDYYELYKEGISYWYVREAEIKN